MKKKRLSLGVALIFMVLMLSAIPTFAWYTAAAVGYNKVPTAFWGYRCAIGVQSNYPIETKVIGGYTNNGKKNATYTKNVTMTKDISVGYGSNKKITGSIGLTSGAVSGQLGAEISKSYNFSKRYVRSESDTLTFTVKPKKTVKVKCTCYGDKVMIYYKYFKWWKSTECGCATIYIPRWFHFFTTN